ncbi:MAG: alpha/beta hydrolase [Alkalilacustris sp.]
MSGAAPHSGAPLRRAGAAPAQARLGLVLLHGRGGSAEDILGLARLAGREDIAAIAPQADGHSWWPVSFLAPMEALQPWLDGALAAVDRAVAVLRSEGLAAEDIALAGFSQGGCLALEWAARRGGPLRAVAGLSAGLVGTADRPDGGAEPALYGHRPKIMGQEGRLDGVPVWLGCHAEDPHIPAARVAQSAERLRQLGAQVAHRLHPGAGHGLTRADGEALRRLLQD